MKKWIISLTLAAGVVGLTACNGGGDVIVQSDAGDITKDELYEIMKEQVGEQALQELLYVKVLSEKYKVSDKELDEKVDELKEQYGESFPMLLAQNGLKDENELKEKIFLPQLLIEKAGMKEVKVTDDELKEYYENEVKHDIRASHILVEDEEKAKDILAKLKAGEKFEDLAKEHSTDPGTKEKGGDLDWFNTGDMVTEFEEAAYALKVNEISDPVETQNGWHIIKLTDKKEKESFDSMKEDLTREVKLSKLDAAAIQNIISKEMDAANVKIKDKDLEGILNHGTASAE